MKKKVISSILLLILLLGCYTTSYARSWTSEEVETTLKQICNAYPNYTQSIWITRLLNSNAWNEQKNNIPFDQYSNLIIRIYEESSVKRYVDFIPTNYDGTFTINNNGTVTTSKTETNTGYRFNSLSNSQSYIGTVDRTIGNISLNVDNNAYGGCVLLVENTIYNTNNKVVLGLQQSATMTVPYTTTYVNNNQQYRLGIGFIGSYYNYENIDYRIYNDNGNTIEDYVLRATEVNNGKDVDVYINTSNVISGRTYYIDLYYNNNLLFQYGYGNTLIINENGGNESGDNSGDVIIDLTETNEKLDNIIGIMEEQQETTNILTGQESGENAETFWNNLYKNLFTMESGEVQELIDDFVENTNLEELGTLEVEEQILNILNDEPGDFIIAWNSVMIPNLKNNTPREMIPQGNINFSNMQVNLGEEIHQFGGEHMIQIITAFRVILGYTICVLMIANIWETTTRTLGVGVGMYEANEEEKQRLAEYDYEEYNINEKGTGTYMKGHYNPRTKQRWRFYKEIK